MSEFKKIETLDELSIQLEVNCKNIYKKDDCGNFRRYFDFAKQHDIGIIKASILIHNSFLYKREDQKNDPVAQACFESNPYQKYWIEHCSSAFDLNVFLVPSPIDSGNGQLNCSGFVKYKFYELKKSDLDVCYFVEVDRKKNPTDGIKHRQAGEIK